MGPAVRAKVLVVGSGYVGTVTAVCLAWLGHEVVGFDVDETRVGQLQCGQLPFFEPRLAELLRDTLDSGLLRFTADPRSASLAQFLFLCVGTPPAPGGRPDMTQVEQAVRMLVPWVESGAVIVDKSTVPVGSGDWVRTIVEDALAPGHPGVFCVVSNPEFLREGSMIEDFLHPDRIVLGGDTADTARVASLYERVLAQDFPGGRRQRRPRLVEITRPSAEMTKYAANAFLATKISFANEIAAVCELVGADAREVLPAVGLDQRIGQAFLHHGLGWGGSCFGKDVSALVAMASDYGYHSPILRAATEVNQRQRAGVLRKLQAELKILKGKRVGVLGLAFKAGTDDLRDSPALDVIQRLLAAGAVVAAYDPIVKELREVDVEGLRIAADPYDAAERADALVVATEWPAFGDLDFCRLAERMRGRFILDGRGVIDPPSARAAGFSLRGFGW